MILNSFALLDAFVCVARLVVACVLAVVAANGLRTSQGNAKAPPSPAIENRNYLVLLMAAVLVGLNVVGAVVRIPRAGDVLMRQVHAASGYLSHSSKTLHFGLGSSESVETLEIVWPSGVRQTLKNVAINRLHEIVEPIEQAAGPPDGTSDNKPSSGAAAP